MNKITKPLLAGLFLATCSLSSFAVTLGLMPSTEMTPGGSSFYMDLVASGLGDHTAPSVSAFDVDVSFDPGLFTLTTISFGGGLGDESLAEAMSGYTTGTGSVNLWELSLLDINANTCLVCSPPYLEDLQSGSLVLARLSFAASGLGIGSFGIAVNIFADGLGDPLTYTPLANPNVTVPEPGSFWLFSLASVLLPLARLKGRRAA